jgi:hypothetical protein
VLLQRLGRTIPEHSGRRLFAAVRNDPVVIKTSVLRGDTFRALRLAAG